MFNVSFLLRIAIFYWAELALRLMRLVSNTWERCI